LPPVQPTLFPQRQVYWREQPLIGNRLTNIINSLSSRLPVWLTEYNIRLGVLDYGSPAIGTTWEHALYIAELDMQELESPRVALTDYWDLFGDTTAAQFSGTIPPVATPAGSLSQLINQTMKGATTITILNIAHDPVLDGSVKAVNGISVTIASGGEKFIFVNLGSSPTSLATGKSIPTGVFVEQLSGTLLMQAVRMKSFHVSSELTLPAYSVTAIST